MTNPIPIEPVQIHPQFAPMQPSPGLEMLSHALEQRQQLNLQKMQLQKELDQFELQKRIAGPQMDAMLLENMKRKQDLKNTQDELAARDQALQLYTGNLPRLGDNKGVGEVIAGIKDPRVAAHFFDFLKQGIGIQQGQSQAELTGAQATKATGENAADTATHDILQRYGPQLTTEGGQRAALREILTTAGPDAADQTARALNVGIGRYGHVVGPDGYLYITDSKTGAVRRDTTVGQREGMGQVRLEAIKRNAQTIVDIMDAQSEIVKGSAGLEGSKNPVVAQMLADARVLGISTEALSNAFRTDPQQATQMLRTRFTHNYIGMLPNSRSSQHLLENLSQSYWPPPGSREPVLRRAERDRQHLRAVMAAVRDGRVTDLTRIPGFTEAAAAAAAEGQAVPQGITGPSAPPANPDEFLHP